MNSGSGGGSGVRRDKTHEFVELHTERHADTTKRESESSRLLHDSGGNIITDKATGDPLSNAHTQCTRQLAAISQKLRAFEEHCRARVMDPFSEPAIELTDALSAEISGMIKECNSEIHGLSKIPCTTREAATVRGGMQHQLAQRLLGCMQTFRRTSSRIVAVPQQRSDVFHDVDLSESSERARSVQQLIYNPQFTEARIAHMETDERLVEEREREITQIARDIAMLSSIFSELNVLVLEQQPLVDRIEDNTKSAARDLESATSEISHAERYQRKAAFRACIFLLIVCVVGIGCAILVFGVQSRGGG